MAKKRPAPKPEKAKSQLAFYRDRITELVRVPANEIRANERNWHRHGTAQADAMRGVLNELGFVAPVIAWRNEDGELEMLDGHLRADLADGSVVPVAVLDVDRAEADKILATFDPLGALGATDEQALLELLSGLEWEDKGAQHAAEDLALRMAAAGLDDDDEPGQADGTESAGLPLMPHEHYDFVLVLARTTQQWGRLCDLLALRPVKGDRRMSSIGLGRAIEAQQLIELLEGRDAEHADRDS